MLMALLVLVQSASTPVTDDAPHPIFDRIAETILAAAPREGDPVPESWFVAGQRARAARWHLAEPDDGDGWYRRTGWISEDGLQAGVAACGPEDGVAMLGFQLPGETGPPLRDSLAWLGTVTSETLASDQWTFTPEGRTPVNLTLETVCTPEGSAAARSCRTHVTAVLSPGHEDRSCIAP